MARWADPRDPATCILPGGPGARHQPTFVGVAEVGFYDAFVTQPGSGSEL